MQDCVSAWAGEALSLARAHKIELTLGQILACTSDAAVKDSTWHGILEAILVEALSVDLDLLIASNDAVETLDAEAGAGLHKLSHFCLLKCRKSGPSDGVSVQDDPLRIAPIRIPEVIKGVENVLSEIRGEFVARLRHEVRGWPVLRAGLVVGGDEAQA